MKLTRRLGNQRARQLAGQLAKARYQLENRPHTLLVPVALFVGFVGGYIVALAR